MRIGLAYAKPNQHSFALGTTSDLGEVKKHLTLQRGSYKRVERLSLLLNLYTLKRNRRDKEAEYERIISEVD